MSTVHAEHFACGPLDVEVASESEPAHRKIADTLELYNVPWPDALTPVKIAIHETGDHAPLGRGRYLACARMFVDPAGERGESELIATFRSGAWATGNPRAGRWEVHIPRNADDFWMLIDLESLVSLVLTEGWRAAGWVPVHAGTVVRDGKCAMICAESGGGKTSLTAAMIRRGWQTLGDDKLLLRIRPDGTPELRALVHTFNLHPRARSWFPEVGDLESLPAYSGWTEKRKVHPEEIWSGTTLAQAVPTHLLSLTRNVSGAPVRIAQMDAGAVLSTLLHQTVVPSDPRSAKPILSTVAAAARKLSGLSVDLGDDVYDDPEQLASLEQALQ